MISRADFPRLTDQNHQITSPSSWQYNCVAWAAGDSSRWWEPRSFWPVEHESDFGLAALERAFHALGFQTATDGSLVPGVEKIALYVHSTFWTHVARQLPNGVWSSKLGGMEDIEHRAPEHVAGGVYGEVAGFMMRMR